MIGKILAGLVGAKAAESSKVGGTGGALLGMAAVSLVRRLSLPALAAIAVGGYAASKLGAKRADAPPQPEPPAPAPAAAKRKPRKTTAKAA